MLLIFLNRVIILFFIIFTQISLANNAKAFFLPEVNLNFVGRKDAMSKVETIFDKKTGEPVVLSGVSGIGKTQIAKEYAYSRKGKYNIIVWINANQDIDLQIKKLVREWNKFFTKENYIDINYLDDNGIINDFKEKLSNTKLRWLFVFDDTDYTMEIIKYLPQKNQKGEGDVLITTKNNLDLNNTQKIYTLERFESLELLKKLTGESNNLILNRLSEVLNDYPLALAQAGAYIKMSPNINVEEYITIYNREKKRLWKYEEKLIDREKNYLDHYNHTVKTVLEINIQEIKEKSKEAYDLLGMLSLIHKDNIPEEIILNYFDKNQLAVSEAVSMLMNYSIITPKQGIKSSHTYVIHEFVQLVMSEYITKKEQRYYMEGALRAFNLFIPTQLDRSLSLISNKFLMSHLNKLCANSVKLSVYNNDLLDLFIRRLEHFLPEKRDFISSAKLIKEISNVIDKVNSVTKLTLARFYLMKAAFAAWKKGDFYQSIDEAKVAEKYLQEYPGAHEELLMLYNRFAQTYILHGDTQNALLYSDLGERIILRSKGFLGNQDAYYSIRSIIFNDIGEFDMAYQNIELSIQKAQNIEREDDRTMIAVPVMLQKALILAKLGKYSEAYSISNLSYDRILKAIPNKENYFNATATMVMAFCLYNQGKLKESEIDINRSIKIFKNIYGTKFYTRAYAFAYLVMGDINVSNKEYELAQQNYLKSEEIYKKILNNLKIDDVSYLYNKLAINATKLKDSYASSYYFNEHKKVFGISHKRTFELNHYMDKHGFIV